MILRRVIEHFRKQENFPLIPAQAGIHLSRPQVIFSLRACRRALDPDPTAKRSIHGLRAGAGMSGGCS